MKRHIFSILILIFCTVFILLNTRKSPVYKVIEVYSGDMVCLDFNINLKCEPSEKIKLYGLNTFSEKFGSQTKYILEKYSIPEENTVVLGVMAKDFTKNQLLNKYVRVEILDSSEKKYKTGKIFTDNLSDFSQILLKEGFGLSNADEYKIYENFSKIKNNIKFSKKFNYQLRNKKNGKIHTLDCKYGRMASNYEIGIFDEDKSDYCDFCHSDKKHKHKNVMTPSINADYESDKIKIYFLDSTTNLKPDSGCKTKACQILLSNINSAKNSIDFAIYGLGNVPSIESALLNAQKRGVKIRYVVDETANRDNIYAKTSSLKSAISNFKTDYKEGESKKFNNFIMHNKFFIFDKKSLWLGTANVSETDLSGYSTNNVVFIHSDELAKIYEKEFEKMYFGTFHTHKKSDGIKNINIGETSITVGFSPQDKVIYTQIIPLIKNAAKSIYLETFIITHKALAENLIEAHKKGIDVKIIVDATTASSSYSMVKNLRSNGINVKVENYAGKMHMKNIIIDDDIFITGSMNLTKSGESYNDENLLIIKNKSINQKAKMFFNYMWSKIPDKYLTKNPKAESKASIGSCYDGIDNDYDGKIDKADDSCR